MISLKRLTIIFLLLVIMFTGCDLLDNLDDNNYYPEDSITGSGHLVQIEKSFTGFTKISAEHSFDITLIESDEYSIQIELDDNIVQYLDVHKEGSSLDLELTGNNSYNDITLKAVISIPAVEFIGLSGACKINLAGFEMDNSLVIDLSGAGRVTGQLECVDLNLNLSGASYVGLEGACNDLTIHGSGASNIYLPEFKVAEASVYLSGASLATINAAETLSAYLSGASVLYYMGNPSIGTLQISGTAYIRHI